MRLIHPLLVLFAAASAAFIACEATDASHVQGHQPLTAKAELKRANGEVIGSAEFVQTEKGVKITTQVSGLPPGSHAIHIHEKGECVGPDFKSAGSHLEAKPSEHGLNNPKGPHSGDLPALQVSADGVARSEATTDRVTLKTGKKNSLIRPGGTSLVIHEKLDDQKTEPSGKSGDRVACGVIVATSGAAPVASPSANSHSH